MEKNSIILFSRGNVTNWKGLPKDLSIEALIKLFGKPSEPVDDILGNYPAVKYSFTIESNNGGLIAFVRDNIVILIETKTLPDDNILREFSAPDTILPYEILVEGAYAAELIFSGLGLNLTVAKHFDKSKADKIIRCRGFEKMDSPEKFDSRYYKSFEDSTLW